MAAAETINLRAAIAANAHQLWPGQVHTIMLVEVVKSKSMVAEIHARDKVLMTSEVVSVLNPEAAYHDLLMASERALEERMPVESWDTERLEGDDGK